MNNIKCPRCQAYMSKSYHKMSNHERYCKMSYTNNAILTSLKRLISEHMKQTLTIILLLLSTILYSQTKVVITTEEGKVGKYFEDNQVLHHLYCIDCNPCSFILYLDKGDYGFVSTDYKRIAWFRIEKDSVYVLDKSKDLNFTIKQE